MGKKILVADDERAIADLIGKVLIDEGYEVRLAIQSLRIYDAIREFRPELILLDLLMPYLEGEDILRLMQLSPDTATIPVIVVTAKLDVGVDEPVLRKLGVRHIVRKPFDLDILLRLIGWTFSERTEQEGQKEAISVSPPILSPKADGAREARTGRQRRDAKCRGQRLTQVGEGAAHAEVDVGCDGGAVH